MKNKVLNENKYKIFFEPPRECLKNIGIINIAGFAIAILILIISCIFTYRHGYKMINSDNSAEFILGKLLAENNQIISKDWFYSTEIRFFNTNIVIAFAWKLFHTYSGVMAFSQLVLLILLYASQAYFYKELNCRYYLVWPIILLMPLSVTYFSIVTFGLYYIPHISISFWVLGLLLSTLKKENYSKVNLIVSACISLLAGLGGLRQIVVLHLPLFITSIILFVSREKSLNPKGWSRFSVRHVMFCFVNMLMALAGYIINSTYLKKHYKFFDWGTMKFTGVNFDVLRQIINDYFNLVGFGTHEIFSLNGIRAAFSLVIVFVICSSVIFAFIRWSSAKDSIKIITLFACATNACIVLLYLFSDMDYANRYLIPSLVFLFPVCAVLFEGKLGEVAGLWRQTFVVLMSISIIMASSNASMNIKKCDKSVELREAADYLVENGYSFGFATFWNAGILTQLTEDWLKVCAIQDPISFNKYKWLISEDTINHMEEGKVFLLVQMDELQAGKPQSDLLADESKVVFENELYTVYSFEDSEEIYSRINNN